MIIAGFGRVGQIVGRVLRMRRISFTALESSVAQVDFVRRFGNKVYYGDASRLEVLQAAGAARAEVFVLAMDDIDTVGAHGGARARGTSRISRSWRGPATGNTRCGSWISACATSFARRTCRASTSRSTRWKRWAWRARMRVESIRRFDVHDKKQLQAQREIRDDEQKLIQSAQQAARELEQLFEVGYGADADGRASRRDQLIAAS